MVITTAIMSIQLTSITKTPDRLAHMGTEFIRSQKSTNHGLFAHRRKSAVELLEASKGEYVKSTSVLNHRQELKHIEDLHVTNKGRQRSKTIPGLLSKSKSEHSLVAAGSSTPGTPQNDTERAGSAGKVPSVADRLSQVLNPEDVPPPIPAKQERPNSTGKVSSVIEKFSQVLNSESSPAITDSHKINSSKHDRLGTGSDHENSLCVTESSSVQSSNNNKILMERRLIPKDMDKLSSKPRDFLLPISHQSLSTSVTVLVEKRCSGSSPTPGSGADSVIRRKKKPLHRSQSDLSCRHSRNSSDFSDLSSRLSRTSTELERFFNEMGIDRSVLDPMLRLQKKPKTDSELFESLSSLELASEDRSLGSGNSQMEKSETTDKESLKEKNNSPQTTHVERNARIIKWLCNVKKARYNPNPDS